jgi:hypothetical protein
MAHTQESFCLFFQQNKKDFLFLFIVLNMPEPRIFWTAGMSQISVGQKSEQLKPPAGHA